MQVLQCALFNTFYRLNFVRQSSAYKRYWKVRSIKCLEKESTVSAPSPKPFQCFPLFLLLFQYLSCLLFLVQSLSHCLLLFLFAVTEVPLAPKIFSAKHLVTCLRLLASLILVNAYKFSYWRKFWMKFQFHHIHAWRLQPGNEILSVYNGNHKFLFFLHLHFNCKTKMVLVLSHKKNIVKGKTSFHFFDWILK